MRSTSKSAGFYWPKFVINDVTPCGMKAYFDYCAPYCVYGDGKSLGVVWDTVRGSVVGRIGKWHDPEQQVEQVKQVDFLFHLIGDPDPDPFCEQRHYLVHVDWISQKVSWYHVSAHGIGFARYFPKVGGNCTHTTNSERVDRVDRVDSLSECSPFYPSEAWSDNEGLALLNGAGALVISCRY